VGEYAPSAPAWVMRYPSAILGTAKETLWAVWSRTSHEEQQTSVVGTRIEVHFRIREDMTPAESMRAALCELTGSTDSAVRKQLEKLRSTELVETRGNVAVLFVRPHHQPLAGVEPAPARGQPREQRTPARGQTDPQQGSNQPRLGVEPAPARGQPLIGSPSLPSSPLVSLPRATGEPRQAHQRPKTQGPTAPESREPAKPPNPTPAAAPPAHGPSHDALARHAAIARSQGWDRKRPTDDGAPIVPDEIQAALDAWPNRSRWALELENREWLRWLAQAVAALQIDGRTLVELLDAHDTERARLDAEGSRHEAENRGTFPRRNVLWWSYGAGKGARAWVSNMLEQIEKRRNRAKPPTARKRLLDPCSIEYEQQERERAKTARARGE
jgi:hypothetical protein